MLAIKLLVWMAVRVSGQNPQAACNSLFAKFKNLDRNRIPYFGFKERATNVEHCLFRLAVDKFPNSGGHKVFQKAEAAEECLKYESWLPQLHNVPFIKQDNNQFGGMAGMFSGHVHDHDQQGFVPLGAKVKGSWRDSPRTFKLQWDKGTNVETEVDKSKAPMNTDGDHWRSADKTSIVVLFSYNAAWRAYKPNQLPMGNRIHLYCHYFPAEPRTTTTTSTSTTTTPTTTTLATTSTTTTTTTPTPTPTPTTATTPTATSTNSTTSPTTATTTASTSTTSPSTKPTIPSVTSPPVVSTTTPDEDEENGEATMGANQIGPSAIVVAGMLVGTAVIAVV